MSYVLSALGVFSDNRRRQFNPGNKKDLLEFAYFRKYNKWQNGCPFFLEWPYADIVSMCLAKYTDHEFADLV